MDELKEIVELHNKYPKVVDKQIIGRNGVGDWTYSCFGDLLVYASRIANYPISEAKNDEVSEYIHYEGYENNEVFQYNNILTAEEYRDYFIESLGINE